MRFVIQARTTIGGFVSYGTDDEGDAHEVLHLFRTLGYREVTLNGRRIRDETLAYA